VDNYFSILFLYARFIRDLVCKPDIYLGSRLWTSGERWKLELCSLHVQIYFAFLAAKEASMHCEIKAAYLCLGCSQHIISTFRATACLCSNLGFRYWLSVYGLSSFLQATWVYPKCRINSALFCQYKQNWSHRQCSVHTVRKAANSTVCRYCGTFCLQTDACIN
jgi:hypothetical protein